ncbi:hypothetical protein JOQ06_029490 [Pogonophryne albipinna]|uniref:Uncharacterized protein n=1 Tax=Pogonophryne albipinna TaxID=1090488 RepID=A0AAD6A7M7_9TELE|nr:hypothetical protein JOQ06_029490 [Pogonophryne albipinna]
MLLCRRSDTLTRPEEQRTPREPAPSPVSSDISPVCLTCGSPGVLSPVMSHLCLQVSSDISPVCLTCGSPGVLSPVMSHLCLQVSSDISPVCLTCGSPGVL